MRIICTVKIIFYFYLHSKLTSNTFFFKVLYAVLYNKSATTDNVNEKRNLNWRQKCNWICGFAGTTCWIFRSESTESESFKLGKLLAKNRKPLEFNASTNTLLNFQYVAHTYLPVVISCFTILWKWQNQ